MNVRGIRAWSVTAALVFTGVGLAAKPVGAVAPPDGGSPSGEPVAGDVIEGRYIVQLAPSDGVASSTDGVDLHARVEAVMAELADGRDSTASGVADEVLFELGIIDGFAAQLSPESAERLAGLPGVAVVEPDTVVTLADEVVTDIPADNGGPIEVQPSPPWGLDRIDQVALPLNQAYAAPNGGDGVHIYVIDQGIWGSHVEFPRGLGLSIDLLTPPTNPACFRHGTHVAGTAAGATIGVAKQATLHSVRMLGCGGSGSNSDLVRALNWVLDNAEYPAVVNLSLGAFGQSPAEEVAINNLAAAGVVSVAAAGNNSGSACSVRPARYPAVITVGASDATDKSASFSNWGTCVDLYAPGVGVSSAGTGSSTDYITLSGTSMASPHVAGVVATYLHDYPNATAAQVQDAIVAGAAEGQLTGLRTSSPNRLLNLQALPAPAGEGYPVAKIAPVASAVAYGSTTVFDGSASFDPEGLELSYEWTIKDPPEVVSQDPTYSRLNDEPGWVMVRLKVTNAVNKSATTYGVIRVPDPVPPVATFTPDADQYVTTGASLSFDGSGSNDPDGGSLTYVWRSTGVSGVASSTSSYSRTFNTPGRFGVQLTVTDDEGQTATKHINVRVAAPVPPVATFTPDADQYVTTGASLSFDGSGSNDPDGGSLTYVWRSTGVWGVASSTSSYSRTFNTPGRFGVELKVIDDEGQTATKRINVWVAAPAAPVATFTPGVDQRVAVGTSLSFDGSGSNDPDGGSLTYVWRSTGVSGVASSTSSFSRTFNTRGRFGVQLTVTDDEGQTATKHINVWVS